MARVTINGVPYVTDGQVVMQPITEFVTAVRQGNPSNDDRNLANFVTFEDARGGIGVIRGDIRQDFDKLADNDGGVLVTRFNEAILAPRNVSTAFDLTGIPGSSSVVRELGNRQYVAKVNKLYYSDTTNLTLTLTSANPYAASTISDMCEYTDPVTGTKRWYLGATDSSDLVYFTDPTAGSPFTTVAGISAQMLFEYDGKLWAGGAGVLRWSIDPTNAAAWNVAAPTGAWPNAWKFLGVFQFGQGYYPYVLVNPRDGEGYLAVLDLDNYTIYRVATSLVRIVDAFEHAGNLVVIHQGGLRVSQYSPQAQSIIDLHWRSSDRQGWLGARNTIAVFGCSSPDGPIVFGQELGSVESPAAWVAGGGSGNNGQVYLFRGTGWHPLTATGELKTYSGIFNHRHSSLLWVSEAAVSSYLYLNERPWHDEAFTPGTNQVKQRVLTGSIITPWYSFGFDNLEGPLLSVQCGGYIATNQKVKVEYQINGVETSWTTLGTFPNTGLPASPEISGRSEAVEQSDVMLFGDSLAGVSFRTVRFKFTLTTTSGESYLTPNAFPMVIRFLKRPKLRQSIRFNIDVEKTVAERDDGTKGYDDIWATLKALYDSETVPELQIGNYHTWAALTAMPFILDLGGENEDDIAARKPSEQTTLAVTFVEFQ